MSESFSEIVDRVLPACHRVRFALEDGTLDCEDPVGYSLWWALHYSRLGYLVGAYEATAAPHQSVYREVAARHGVLRDDLFPVVTDRIIQSLAILLLTSTEFRDHVVAMWAEAQEMRGMHLCLFPQGTPLYERFRYIARHMVGAHFYELEPESPHDTAEHLRVSLNLILQATKGARPLRADWLEYHSEWLDALNDSEVDQYTA